MTDPSVEPRILKFSDYATSKVVDVDADFVRLNLISFDDTYGKIGVFAGKTHMRMSLWNLRVKK